MDKLNLEDHTSLLNEVRILQLIYHRNKNQHRMATWWRYFQMLLRHLKHFFINDDYKIIELINKKKLMKKCFYEFYGIIKLGQFMSLGFVLVASLSRIHKLLERFSTSPVIVDMKDDKIQAIAQLDLGEDVGEEVILEEVTNVSGKVESESLSFNSKTSSVETDQKTSEKHKSKRSKEKKKKKKKSDIDLIFGS